MAFSFSFTMTPDEAHAVEVALARAFEQATDRNAYSAYHRVISQIRAQRAEDCRQRRVSGREEESKITLRFTGETIASVCTDMIFDGAQIMIVNASGATANKEASLACQAADRLKAKFETKMYRLRGY